MLKFFRKIRAALIAEGKTAKYLKYAIGEILLVMIGILLALQVNNWNEYRKERIEENKILREISRNLEIEIKAIDRRIILMQSAVKKIEKLLTLIEQDSIIMGNAMDSLFGVVRPFYLFDLNMTPFQELNSKGISIISDDSLKLELTNVYDVMHRRFENYNKFAEKGSDNLGDYYLKNFNNLSYAVRKESATPNNIDKVVNDSYYVNLVERKSAMLRRQIGYYFTAKEGMKKLKERIDRHFGEF